MTDPRLFFPILTIFVRLITCEASQAGDLAPASPDEPLAKTLSMERAAGYLDEVALDWTRDRKCGTCHTNYAYMLSRPSVRGIGSPDAMK